MTEKWQSPEPNMIEDIGKFHERFGLRQPYEKQPVRTKETPDLPVSGISVEEWELRHVRLRDELAEYDLAVEVDEEVEILDALVDLVYIALGTAYRRGWDFAEAWKRVHSANMAKERGSKQNSKYGSGYDVVKPDGWQAPDLSDLVGSLLNKPSRKKDDVL